MKNTSILLSGFWWYAKHSGSTAMHASAAVPMTPAQMADMASSSAYAKITTGLPCKRRRYRYDGHSKSQHYS